MIKLSNDLIFVKVYYNILLFIIVLWYILNDIKSLQHLARQASAKSFRRGF